MVLFTGRRNREGWGDYSAWYWFLSLSKALFLKYCQYTILWEVNYWYHMTGTVRREEIFHFFTRTKHLFEEEYINTYSSKIVLLNIIFIVTISGTKNDQIKRSGIMRCSVN